MSEQEMNCSSFRKCKICENIYHPAYFTKQMPSGKIRKRVYCNSCEDKYSKEVIGDILKIIDSKKKKKRKNRGRKRGTIKSLSVHDLDDTRYGYIQLLGQKSSGRKYTGQLTLEKAKQYVNEYAGFIVDKYTIKKLYNSTTIKNFVLQRDKHTCQFCHQPANVVGLIISKSEGGIKSPLNTVATCQVCQDPKKRPKESLKSSLLKSEDKKNINQVVSRLSNNEHVFPVIFNNNEKNNYKIKVMDRNIAKTILDKDTLEIYNDCSISTKADIYAGSNIYVGNSRILINRIDFVHFEKNHSTYGEFETLLNGLKQLKQILAVEEHQYKEVIIYSDVEHIQKSLDGKVNNDIQSLVIEQIKIWIKHLETVYPKTKFTIKYLEDKENYFYNLAHNNARLAIKNKINK